MRTGKHLIVCLPLVLAIAGGCDSSNRLRDVTAEREALRGQVISLKEQLAATEQGFAELQRSWEALRDENSTVALVNELRATIDNLKAENAGLEERVAELNQELGRKAAESDALRARLKTQQEYATRIGDELEFCKEALAQVVEASRTPDVIESQIDGEFTGWEGETVFKLMNGQIWQQTSYAYHYHYAYMPAVTISKTSRGYKMQVEGVSETIYVTRIK